ncbi:MAG TPA: tetratricopeptide repeat protein [bacterium]|nr:tetratricopeptide repeat protein [bacterium]
MTDPDKENVSKEIYEAFRRIKEKDFEGAESLLKNGLEKAETEKNVTQSALFFSSLGVLSKIKGEFKDAWRYYEKAEKLLPEDPALKIIMAKLLIDRFAQYDNALKKLKHVLKVAKGSASFEHQAHATMAMAYLKKGEKKKAIEMLDEAMVDDFANVTSAENLNFDVIEAFLSRNLEIDRCQKYVEKALALARSRREVRPVQFLEKLLESFEVTVH